MKSFRYSMENILDYRKNIEEDEKQKFSRLQREHIRQSDILKDLEKKLKKTMHSLYKSNSNTIQLKDQQKYIDFLSQRKEIKKQNLKDLKVELDKKREEMVFAQRDRKIIEKHKEKSLGEHKDRIEQVEQKNIDEMALYMYMRR